MDRFLRSSAPARADTVFVLIAAVWCVAALASALFGPDFSTSFIYGGFMAAFAAIFLGWMTLRRSFLGRVRPPPALGLLLALGGFALVIRHSRDHGYFAGLAEILRAG